MSNLSLPLAQEIALWLNRANPRFAARPAKTAQGKLGIGYILTSDVAQVAYPGWRSWRYETREGSPSRVVFEGSYGIPFDPALLANITAAEIASWVYRLYRQADADLDPAVPAALRAAAARNIPILQGNLVAVGVGLDPAVVGPLPPPGAPSPQPPA